MLDEDFEYRDIPEPAGGLRGEYPEITLRFSREAAYRVLKRCSHAEMIRIPLSPHYIRDLFIS